MAGLMPGLALARHPDVAAIRPRRHPPSLISKLLSTTVTGFPTVVPTFAASFLPGPGPTQMVRTESWDDFSAAVATMSSANQVLACYTAIQSMNRTWFYGAFQPGSGAYYLLRTTDPSAFQQAFNQNQGSYNLVDFNIIFEMGQVYYTGYWLASGTPKVQTLLVGLSFQDLVSQWTTLSNNNNRMTRIQVFPQFDASSFAALFEQGGGGYILYVEPADAFANDVTAKFSGNTLIGLGFDPVSGNMAGCWRDKSNPSQFAFNQDWPTLMATTQQANAGGMILAAMTAYPNAPDFDSYFEANLTPFTMGYGYAVAKDGVIISTGQGYARSPNELQNPGTPFTGDTRLNLASVSKAVTGVALEVLLQQHSNVTLDSPFWPLIQNQVPNPNPGVKTVTLRNLATMKSGLMQEYNEGPITPPNGDFWGYLNTYLAQPLEGTPGVTYYYDNTNFSILQGVIEEVSGMDYVTFVTQYVLDPAGINPAIFSATPDPPNTAALTYGGPGDQRAGFYWGPLGFVAPAGWISSAHELVKVAAALRGTSVLPAAVVSEMLNDGIGWYTSVGNFGTYYQHNGSIGNGLNPPQRLNTALVRLGEGYDIALVSDSLAPADVVGLCISAFDSRGVPAASLPPNAVSVATVVHAASFLPAIAPGAFVAIFGAGFAGAAQDWTATIGSSGVLPQELAQVQVRVAGQPAYVNYVSPTQINVLLPSGLPPGDAIVEVTNGTGGITAPVTISSVAPGFFAYRLHGVLYAAALFAGSDVYVAAHGALPGYPSRAAQAGDVIEFYGSGMGPTDPPAPNGLVLAQDYPAVDLAAFQASIGGIPAQVLYAGLVGAGLYQVNVQVPNGLTGGDQPVILTASGQPTQPNVMITVQA